MRFDRVSFKLVLLASLALSAVPLGTQAAAVYDGFGYPPGVDLGGQNGGSGWTGAWFNQGGAPTLTTAADLGFGDLAVTPGAATTPTGNGITTYPRFFPNNLGANNSTLFLSFLLRPEAGFGEYGGMNLGGFFVGKSGLPVTTYSLEGGSVGNVAASNVVAQAGTTVFLVMRAQFQAGNDIFDLFVNPEPGLALPAAADATLYNVDLDLMTNNFLYINNPGGWTIDEMRLGSTFAEVSPSAVPLPSSLLLLAAGLIVFPIARRGVTRSLAQREYSIRFRP